jgi:hypothetical protein
MIDVDTISGDGRMSYTSKKTIDSNTSQVAELFSALMYCTITGVLTYLKELMFHLHSLAPT